MAKLSEEQIKNKLSAKGFTLIDATNYQNKQSPITIQCIKGHKVETTIDLFDRVNFTCPTCMGMVPSTFTPTKNVPEKHGYRVVAFDQATEKLGVSIYDNGKLVYCDLLRFTGDLISRLSKIKKLLVEVVIARWRPDFIMFEDIQQQHDNVLTYKILSMLLGICEITAFDNGIEFEAVSPVVWRSYVGVTARGRDAQKREAVQLVKKIYDINVIDDTAEAILIGKYAATKHSSKMAF